MNKPLYTAYSPIMFTHSPFPTYIPHHISMPRPIVVSPPRIHCPLFMVPKGSLSTTYKSGTDWEERTGGGKGELARARLYQEILVRGTHGELKQ